VYAYYYLLPVHVCTRIDTHSGECWPDSKKPDRLTVIFTAGELRPSRGQDLTAWNAVFKPKGDTPPVPPGLRKRLKNLLLKALMGLQPPQGTDSAGVQSYTMRRAPHGTFFKKSDFPLLNFSS
jgi:hypothetical protein